MSKGSLKRGIRLYNSKKYRQALEELLTVEDEPSENPDLSFYLGLSYTKLDLFEDALLYLEQSITAGITGLPLYQARMLLGYIYTVTKRYKLARFEFQQLLDAGYESVQLYAMMGFIAYEQKKWDVSTEYLDKAVLLDPENLNAVNSLGYVLAERGVRLDEALKLCKKAAARKPKNPAYLDSLGWVYYKLEQYPEAREYLRKALNGAPGNKTIASHLRAIMTGKQS